MRSREEEHDLKLGGGGDVGCCEHRAQGFRRRLIFADDLAFLKFEQHFSGLQNVIKTPAFHFSSVFFSLVSFNQIDWI